MQRHVLHVVVTGGRSTWGELIRVIGHPRATLEPAVDALVAAGLVTRRRGHSFEFIECDLPYADLLRHERFPAGPVIPLIYQTNLLSDTLRMDAFSKAINAVVTADDVVIDLGCGVGTLSMLAARRARRVYAVEADPEIADAAEAFLRDMDLRGRIQLVRSDGRDVDLPEQGDVLLCEMIDTALIAELQVPVVNHAIRQRLLRPDAQFIPCAATTFGQLIEVDWSYQGLTLPLLHFQAYGADRVRRALTGAVEITTIPLNVENDAEINRTLRMQVTNAGIVNAVRLTTDVELTRGVVLGGTEWFAPPLICPLPQQRVHAGDSVKVRVSYEMGGGLNTLSCELEM